MKKIVTFLAVTVLAGGTAMAAGTIRDNCGCGLGTMALGDQEPTVISQVAATFLNGICGNQTFGITSGTLECEPHAGFASNKRLQEYVADNMDRIALDMAAGQGASLEALADLMEVPAAERANVFASLQIRFGDIFTSSEVTSVEVVGNIEKVLNG
jgi:hypothetical protein